MEGQIKNSIEKENCKLLIKFYEILFSSISLSNETDMATTTTATPPSESVIEQIEHVIHYISIGVLLVFMIEISVKMFAFGPRKFFRHKLEVMDAVVVTVAFLLDVFMSKVRSISNTL